MYTDNGRTGTNFERPEWNSLMEDALRGRINCIIVKDLSRVGRNYKEAGWYIEQVFPQLGIRLISVNEQIDTAVETDMMTMNIRNIVNEFYARDISEKVRSSCRARMKKGIMYTNVPYGYRLEKEGRGKKKQYSLAVDEEPAGVVAMMFEWADKGISTAKIAERLTLMGVVPPEKYRDELFWNEESDWKAWSVHCILTNETYTGTYVAGKTETNLHKEKKVPKEKWLKISEHHEPIVSMAQFERVQGILAGNPRSIAAASSYVCDRDNVDDGNRYPGLLGMFVCEACGSQVRYRKARGFYVCDKHSGKKGKKGRNLFKSPMIRENDLNVSIDAQCDAYRLKLAEFNMEDAPDIMKVSRRVEAAEKRWKEAVKKNDEAYRQYTYGEITRQTYFSIRDKLVQTVELTERALQKAMMAKAEETKKLESIAALKKGDDGSLGAIADKVVLKRDGIVEVVFKGQDIVEAAARHDEKG